VVAKAIFVDDNDENIGVVWCKEEIEGGNKQRRIILMVVGSLVELPAAREHRRRSVSSNSRPCNRPE